MGDLIVRSAGSTRRTTRVLWAAGIILCVAGPPAVTTSQAADRASALLSGSATLAGTASSQDTPSRPIETETDSSDEGRSPTSQPVSGESFLKWMIRASFPIGILIVLMSFYLIALVVWMFLNYRTIAAIPAELLRDVRDLLDQSQYNEAYHRLAADSSFLARVLSSGVRKLPAGLMHAQRAMELTNEDVTMEMEHRTTYLATVGTLGPLIGLVGTVYGMIMAFRVIALEGAAPQASQLADGISTALFATLEGIAISIPAIFFYAMFRNRIARLSLEVALTAEPLLEQFAACVRIPMPNATPAPVPAPAAYLHPFAVSVSRSTPAGPPQTALPPAEN
jgi:biopolymer transport protein ExbB